MRLGSRFEVDRDVIDTFAIGDRDEDVLIHLSLGLIYLLYHRVSDLHQFVHTALEAVQRGFRQLIAQFSTFAATELLFVERQLDREGLHHFELQPLVVIGLACLEEDGLCRLADHVRDVHADTLTHQGVTTFGVDEVTLLVHHIVVLDEALTDTEVVLLDLLLGALNALRDHGAFNHLALLEAQTVHDRGNALGGEQTHQLVLE